MTHPPDPTRAPRPDPAFAAYQTAVTGVALTQARAGGGTPSGPRSRHQPPVGPGADLDQALLLAHPANLSPTGLFVRLEMVAEEMERMLRAHIRRDHQGRRVRRGRHAR